MKKMKKFNLLLLAVVACIGISTDAFAQGEFAIGIKGGLNFSNVNTNSAGATYDSRTGYNAGAFVLLKFGKIGIQPEVLFSSQGSKVHYNFNNSVDQNFSYVNIPVIVKLYTVAGINLQIGPQFGFLTNDPVVKDPSGSGQDIKGAYKKSDVSAALGVGWDLPFGLTIDARYNLGLTKINNNAAISDTKNQVWQLSVGYKLFKIGK
jgi:hypothetical protein